MIPPNINITNDTTEDKIFLPREGYLTNLSWDNVITKTHVFYNIFHDVFHIFFCCKKQKKH